MSPASCPQENRLLSALPAEVLARLRPGLERIALPLGRVLCEPGNAMKRVYFPCDCIVSRIYVTEDGHSAEISVVGNDGIVGIAVFMGGSSMPSQLVVQSAGDAYWMYAAPFKIEFDHPDGVLRTLALRYTQTLITQMAQTAVCNRHHGVAQQLARWILLSLDRLPGNQLTMTQELIANMLGVRREGVTEAAGQLRELGVIAYRRGHIEVLDRPRLEALVCECYRVVKAETDRLFPPCDVDAARPLPIAVRT